MQKVTRGPDAVDTDDARLLRDIGVSRQAVEDALMVTYCFSIITRLADSFGWRIPDEGGLQASARSLLERGYLMPLRKSTNAP